MTGKPADDAKFSAMECAAMTDWTPIQIALPPLGEPVEWCRCVYGLGNSVFPIHGDKPFVAAWAEFAPEFNTWALHWRPLSAKLREVGLV